MRLPFTARTLSLVILGLTLVLLAGGMIYKWYSSQKEYYVAGAPPKDILQRVEPKKVPYENIKPPSLTANDTFIIGSATTSYYGIIFFGDYTDAATVKAFKETEAAAQTFKGKVRLVWRQLPATVNDGDVSFEAAMLSECSRLLNPSWPAHKALLDASAQGIKKSTLEDITDKLDPTNMLLVCQEDANLRKSIRQSIERYRGDGIDVSPFVFVGSQAFPASKATTQALTQAIRNLVK